AAGIRLAREEVDGGPPRDRVLWGGRGIALPLLSVDVDPAREPEEVRDVRVARDRHPRVAPDPVRIPEARRRRVGLERLDLALDPVREGVRLPLFAEPRSPRPDRGRGLRD